LFYVESYNIHVERWFAWKVVDMKRDST